MKRNYVLEAKIKKFVSEHPGLMRTRIARSLQKAGLHFGLQHISNKTGELIALGELKEQINEDGHRLVYPAEEISL